MEDLSLDALIANADATVFGEEKIYIVPFSSGKNPDGTYINRREIGLEPGMNVVEALEKAGVKATRVAYEEKESGNRIELDTEEQQKETKLKKGDIIFTAGSKIAGNERYYGPTEKAFMIFVKAWKTTQCFTE